MPAHRRDLPRPVVDYQPPARLPVASSSPAFAIEIGPAFGQQRHRQHLLSGHPAQPVEVDGHRLRVVHRGRGGVMLLTSTLAYPSPLVSPGGLVDWSTWRVRRAHRSIQHPQHLVIARTRERATCHSKSTALSKASNASLDEVRAVWETNVFGVLAVYQAMLPLIRESSDGRIVNVSSGVGSLTTNADPSYPYHATFGPVYPASKAALNAITLAMMIELESTDIKINLVSPAFTSTNLNGYEGTESVEDGSREVVRVALLGPDGPTGTFTRWENETIPW